jgi:hypothetical protein
VYSINLRKGRHVYVRLSPSVRRSIGLVLWNPGTPTVEGEAAVLPDRAATAVPVGGQQRLAFLVPKSGTYYLEVDFVPPAQGRISYSLSVATS